MTLTLATAGSGVARSAHFITPTGASTPIRTLLVEPQRTNRVLQSQTLGNAAWVATNVTVTADNENAPDGTATADTLDATVNGGSLVQAVTFTGTTGVRALSVYLKAGTASVTDLEVYDLTAATSRRVVRVTWTGGVPTVAAVSGAGVIHTVVALANGWYRIRFNADGVVAGTLRNEVRIFPGGTASTGSVIVWGVQGEEGSVGSGVTPAPTQYIATVGTTVTRNQDLLTFPLTFSPQSLTVYYRGIAQGDEVIGTNRSLVHIGTNSNQQSSFVISTGAASQTIYNAIYRDASGSSSTSVSIAAWQMGDIVEVRGVIAADWRAILGISVNGGAESTTTAPTAATAITTWTDPTIRFGASSTGGVFAVSNAATHLVIAAGNQTMATMRTLAGVA